MDRVGCFFDLTPMRQLPAVFLCFLECAPGDMRTKCFMSGLLVSGCARVTDQLYSKKNFNSQSFVADMSECKRQNPSFMAIRGYVADSRDRTSYADDAMIRECMKAKGYAVHLETK
jgi:hypothetical protein